MTDKDNPLIRNNANLRQALDEAGLPHIPIFDLSDDSEKAEISINKNKVITVLDQYAADMMLEVVKRWLNTDSIEDEIWEDWKQRMRNG